MLLKRPVEDNVRKEEEEVIKLLPPEVYDIFKEKFAFKTFTPVQRDSIKQLVQYKDAIVQSPTGSGKTLAYLLSIFAILTKKKKSWNPKELVALILVPSRELALQVYDVANNFVGALNISVGVATSGKRSKDCVKKILDDGVNVLISTPGRLEHMLTSNSAFKNSLKCLEILVVDEADRFIEIGFKKSISEILSAIPKQRRTGLFSATQTKEFEELLKFGLRDTVRVVIADLCKARMGSESSLITPSSLENYYAYVDPEQKLSALIEFLRSQPQSKVLVFLTTCSCVEYMKAILPLFLKKRQIFAIHGKKKKNRESQMALFRSTPKAVMLSTDIMSRGIDIPDIDWIVQFDIPRQSSWVVHRSGRSGRCGRIGKSILLLARNQEAYLEFIQRYERLDFHEYELPGPPTPEKAKQIRQKIIKMASRDRFILECGTNAFISFIESYMRQDCSVVCPFKELDVVGYAHAYGLLRFPKLKELRDLDLSGFKRSDVDTSQISFKDKNREKYRLLKLESLNKIKESKASTDIQSRKAQSQVQQSVKRKRKREDMLDWEETASDFALLKKIKGGRLSKKEIRGLN